MKSKRTADFHDDHDSSGFIISFFDDYRDKSAHYHDDHENLRSLMDLRRCRWFNSIVFAY